MSQSREAEASVFFRNDHPEEFFLLDVVPNVFRKVFVFPSFEVVDECAKLFDRAIDKGFFFRVQRRIALFHEALEVGATREQFAFDPNIACFQRGSFRFRNLRNELQCLHSG